MVVARFFYSSINAAVQVFKACAVIQPTTTKSRDPFDLLLYLNNQLLKPLCRIYLLIVGKNFINYWLNLQQN
jgi:hypothetical protein